MLLTSVVIVLREVLEAALLLSILLAVTRKLRLDDRWLGYSLLLGATGAALYGAGTDTVSEWLEGVGQEVTNALLQFAIYLLVVVINALFIINLPPAEKTTPSDTVEVSHWRLLTLCMGAVFSLAIAREGSEILLYLSSFIPIGNAPAPEHLPSVAAGSIIGAGIGFSIGSLFYYLMLSFSRRRSVWLACGLLALVGAGMCVQATSLLIQADWLPSQAPVWDSSGLINERSVTGQLLYALVGYEATPSALQIGVYLASLTAMVLIIVVAATGFHRLRLNPKQ